MYDACSGEKEKTISDTRSMLTSCSTFFEPLERERSVGETSVRETGHDHVCAEAADRFWGTFLRK